MPPATQPSAPRPTAALTIDATGLAADQIEQLIVKTLYRGEATGLALVDRMCLPWVALEGLVERMRAERLIEVRGGVGSSGSGYRYALTDLGRDRAQRFLEVNQYVGAAPVPLATYVSYMRTLATSRGFIDRERLRTGFTDLIVGDDMLEHLGPAVNANKALFLYGPPGNGKTVLAEGIGRAIGGDLYIPYAIDVEGQTVTMFDPINHVAIEVEAADSSSVIAEEPYDRRWVRIKRPVVMVGGELTLDMLDLRFNSLSKFSEAPLQLKANGGILLVDDFGRQRIRPEDLLNRWIVPLESRVDYFTLHSGKKFEVPFDVLIVFATNLDPTSLADEAFLRRIPYKVRVDDPTPEQFARIFELNCRRRGLSYHSVLVSYLQRHHYEPVGRPLRACHPRDLIDQVVALCRYHGTPPMIGREMLDTACATYFVDGHRAAPVTPPSDGAGLELEEELEPCGQD